MLLARPLERWVVHATLLAATLLFAALTETAVLAGIVAGAILAGVAGAFLGVPWGLEGVIAGVALGWLFRACAALWVAAPNLRRTYAA